LVERIEISTGWLLNDLWKQVRDSGQNCRICGEGCREEEKKREEKMEGQRAGSLMDFWGKSS